jgi:peptidoglycan/LPS O-acetylase OafA/YrhL
VNIPSLTGARFFAAAAIVLTHSQVPPLFPAGSFWPFDLSGAVTFFFALSGFVLSINARNASFGQFLTARFARIWPAHVAAICFLFLIFWPYSYQVATTPAEFRNLCLNLALVHAWIPERAVYWSYNAPSWSVSAEMFFYATFPGVLWLMRRSVLHTLLGALAISVGFQLLLGKVEPGIDSHWLGHYNPLVNLPIFALGVAAGEWFKRDAIRKVNGTSFQVGALALTLAANAFFTITDFSFLPPALAYFIKTGGAAPFYLAMILSLAHYDGVISRALSYRTLIFLGEISYSFYLFHQLVIRWYTVNFEAFSPIPLWLQYAGIWVASLAIAATSYVLVEQFFRRAIIALGSDIRGFCKRLQSA